MVVSIITTYGNPSRKKKFYTFLFKFLRIEGKTFEDRIMNFLLLINILFMSIISLIGLIIGFILSYVYQTDYFLIIPYSVVMVVSFLSVIFSMIFVIKQKWMVYPYVMIVGVCFNVVGFSSTSAGFVGLIGCIGVIIFAGLNVWFQLGYVVMVFFIPMIVNLVVKLIIVKEITYSSYELYKVYSIEFLMYCIVFIVSPLMIMISYFYDKFKKNLKMIVEAVRKKDFENPIIKKFSMVNSFSPEISIGFRKIIKFIDSYKAFIPSSLANGENEYSDSDDDDDDDDEKGGEEKEECDVEEDFIEDPFKLGVAEKVCTVVCLRILNLLREENNLMDIVDIYKRILTIVIDECKLKRGGIKEFNVSKIFISFTNTISALQFALKLQKKLDDLNNYYLSNTLQFVTYAIGISRENVIFGVIGAKDTKKNCYFGPAKKLSSTLSEFGMKKGEKIIVDENVSKICFEKFDFEVLDILFLPFLKNKDKLIKVYKIKCQRDSISSMEHMFLVKQANTEAQEMEKKAFKLIEENKLFECKKFLQSQKKKNSKIYGLVNRMINENITFEGFIEEKAKNASKFFPLFH